MKSMKQLCLIGAATLGLLALLPGDAFAQRAPIGGGGMRGGAIGGGGGFRGGAIGGGFRGRHRRRWLPGGCHRRRVPRGSDQQRFPWRHGRQERSWLPWPGDRQRRSRGRLPRWWLAPRLGGWGWPVAAGLGLGLGTWGYYNYPYYSAYYGAPYSDSCLAWDGYNWVDVCY